MTADHYVIERTSDVPLEFDGVLLAHVSSADELPAYVREARWTEHRIYRTDTGKYVVETVGRSTFPDEIDRRIAVVCDEAKEVPAALRAPRTYLTLLARDVLDIANMHDSAIPLTERV